MRQLAKVADNVVALLVRQALTWTLTAVLMVFFLPRAVGDEGLGKITFALALTTMLLVVTNVGTSTFTVKQVALDPRRLSDLLWNAYALRLCLGLGIALCIAGAVRVAPLDADSRWVLTIAALILVVMSLDAAQIAAIQGLEEMRWIAMAEVANKATVTALGIAVLTTGHGVVAFAAVMLAGALVAFGVNFSYVARRRLRRPAFSLRMLRYLVVGGLPFFLTGAVMQFYTWSDTLVLRFMTRDAVVGWFGAARQLYATMNVVPLVIMTAVLPALTRFHAQDRAAMRVAVEKSMLAVLTTGIPLAAALTLLSGEIIGFLRYPPEFKNSVPLLSLLAITLPITGSLMIIGTVVIAADKQKEWAATMTVTAVISLLINVVLIWLFDRANGNGAIGVATAAVLSEGLLIAIGVRLVPAGLLGWNVARSALRCLAAALVMLATMGAVKLALDPGLVPLLLVGAPVYAAALLAVRGVTVGELRFVASAVLRGRKDVPETTLSVASALGREGV